MRRDHAGLPSSGEAREANHGANHRVDHHSPASRFPDLSSDAIGRYVRSLGDFTLAQILAERAEPDSANGRQRHLDLREAAGRVRLAVDDPHTIADLVDDIRKRIRHSQIYEQWASDLLNAAYRAADPLPPLWRDALMIAIDADELHRAAAECGEAVEEARRALYGDDDGR